MFDLVCVSLFRRPFSLNEGIEEFSVFSVLINKNSFLGNFVKNGLSESETGRKSCSQCIFNKLPFVLFGFLISRM